MEKAEWLLAGQVTPSAELKRRAPASLSNGEKTAWAKAKQQDQAKDALARAAARLTPGAVLSVVFKDGELRLMADGMPVFDRIFLNADDGPFIALRWRLALRGRRFVGQPGAEALMQALLMVRRTGNSALREQAEAAGRRVLAYDAAIARNDAAMEAVLSTAYAPTENEKALIHAGAGAPG